MVDQAAHLSIDLTSGQVEVSGSEDFIRSMLPELREWMATHRQHQEAAGEDAGVTGLLAHDDQPVEADEPTTPRVARAATRLRNGSSNRVRRAAIAMTAPQPVNIAGDDTSPSLAVFINDKRPTKDNHTELVTVMSYYLLKYAGLPAVIPGHVVSCYSQLGIRKPKDFDVIFRNIKNRKHWLHGGKAGYTLTNLGDNFVGHDLPHEQ